MSMQQINLYQVEFHKTRQPLRASDLVRIVAVVAVILVIMYGFSYWGLLQDHQQLTKLQQEKAAAEQNLTELKKTNKPLLKNTRLAEDIKRFESWVTIRRQAVEVLSEKRFGNTEGFAEHFTGLARQKINGLWLTSLRFTEGGSQLGLQGSALKPELVPQYLQRLSAENIFAGTRFDSLLIKREKDNKQQVDFQLKSIDEEGDAS